MTKMGLNKKDAAKVNEVFTIKERKIKEKKKKVFPKRYAARTEPKISRNKPCPCGKTVDKIFNGRVDKPIPVRVKYKNCCLSHDPGEPLKD